MEKPKPTKEQLKIVMRKIGESIKAKKEKDKNEKNKPSSNDQIKFDKYFNPLFVI